MFGPAGGEKMSRDADTKEGNARYLSNMTRLLSGRARQMDGCMHSTRKR